MVCVTGAISFHEVRVRYVDAANPALDQVSFDLASGQQCGIVGRTGSGKSTLAKVLFRIVVPESGQVLLDGVDTGHPPLARLRQCMAMVPQDPTLFQGSGTRPVDYTLICRLFATIQVKLQPNHGSKNALPSNQVSDYLISSTPSQYFAMICV